MPDYRIHEVYDLKGSWINRHAKPDKSGHISVFKDNDFKGVIQVGALRARELRRQLRQDSHFLMQMGIMDYSLLLGVHNCYEPRIPGAHCNALQRKPGLNSPRLGGSLDPRNPGTLGPVDEEKLDPVEKAAEPRPHSSSVFNPIQEGHPAAVVRLLFFCSTLFPRSNLRRLTPDPRSSFPMSRSMALGSTIWH